jgi:hypothetical protein
LQLSLCQIVWQKNCAAKNAIRELKLFGGLKRHRASRMRHTNLPVTKPRGSWCAVWSTPFNQVALKVMQATVAMVRAKSPTTGEKTPRL